MFSPSSYMCCIYTRENVVHNEELWDLFLKHLNMSVEITGADTISRKMKYFIIDLQNYWYQITPSVLQVVTCRI